MNLECGLLLQEVGPGMSLLGSSSRGGGAHARVGRVEETPRWPGALGRPVPHPSLRWGFAQLISKTLVEHVP